jgi:hypothetical protein
MSTSAAAAFVHSKITDDVPTPPTATLEAVAATTFLRFRQRDASHAGGYRLALLFASAAAAHENAIKDTDKSFLSR